MNYGKRSRQDAYPDPASISQHRLTFFRERMATSVLDFAEGVNASLIIETIEQATEAFVTAGADVDQAMRYSVELVDSLGIQEAQVRRDTERMDSSFEFANVVAQRNLVHVIGDMVNGDVLTDLREDILTYVRRLHAQARVGFSRTKDVLAMSHENRVKLLRRRAFVKDDRLGLDHLASLTGFDPSHPYIPLVSVNTVLPDTIFRHPAAIAGLSPHEALVPKKWESHFLGRRIKDRTVVGPETLLIDAYKVLPLTRSAAHMVGERTGSRSGPIFHSTDFLADLLVHQNPVIAELLVAKHLDPLEKLPIPRRLDLATVLLLALQRGTPLNQLARELGVAAQTAHNRMNALRALLGNKLDDPDHRLEIMVALRAVLPRWMEEQQ